MKLTEEEKEVIETMAACNYNIKKIALYLGKNKTLLRREWLNEKSEVRYHYDRGKLKADFEIAKKRLQNAQSGNLTADQQHSKETDKRHAEDVKAQLLYCGEPENLYYEPQRLPAHNS